MTTDATDLLKGLRVLRRDLKSYNPDQPRAPAGGSDGGRWTGGGSGSGGSRSSGTSGRRVPNQAIHSVANWLSSSAVHEAIIGVGLALAPQVISFAATHLSAALSFAKSPEGMTAIRSTVAALAAHLGVALTKARDYLRTIVDRLIVLRNSETRVAATAAAATTSTRAARAAKPVFQPGGTFPRSMGTRYTQPHRPPEFRSRDDKLDLKADAGAVDDDPILDELLAMRDALEADAAAG